MSIIHSNTAMANLGNFYLAEKILASEGLFSMKLVMWGKTACREAVQLLLKRDDENAWSSTSTCAPLRDAVLN
jgi:hypothetical protein